MEQEDERKRQRVSEDRISQLPEIAIHRILSFLPIKTAIRTGVLSRRWENFWRSIDTIDFDGERDNQGIPRPNDVNLLEHCFAHLEKVLTVSTFKLVIDTDANGCQPDQLNRFLNLIVEKNPKELDLTLRYALEINYSLPRGLFQLRNLVVLRLNDVVVVPSAISSLPQLKVLDLFSVLIKDQDLTDVLSGCAHIEQLIVMGCWGLSSPVLESSSLKSLEFEPRPYEDFESITLDGSNLRSFVFNGTNNECIIKLRSCREIRDLSVCNLRLDNRWLRNLIRRAPLLENLSIVNCPGFDHLNIRYEHLQKFKFGTAVPMEVASVTVDTPSSVCFHIEIASNWFGYNTEWYEDLVGDLEMFNGLGTLRISFPSTEALEIPREVQRNYGAPLTSIKYLQVDVRSTARNARMLLSDFARYVAPCSRKTLTVNM